MSLAMRVVLLFALTWLLCSAHRRGPQSMRSAQAASATPRHRDVSLFRSLVMRKPLSGLFMPKSKIGAPVR
jgi:hypothetical protein